MAMRIEHQPESHRYVLIDGESIVGEVDYVRQGATLSLVRAEVPLELRGQGLGIPLVRGALEAIRDEGGLSVVPVCPYIAKFMMKNKEFEALRA
jgi:predicted GNAT family acetyltransferase